MSEPDPGMTRLKRPKDYRPAIPPRVKMEVLIRQEGKCACGCGEKLGGMDNTEFDHDPALVNRDWDEWEGDTIPPANDPAHIFAKTVVHHQTKTKKDIKTRDKGRRLVATNAEHRDRMAAKAGRPQPTYPSGSGSRGFFSPDVASELDRRNTQAPPRQQPQEEPKPEQRVVPKSRWPEGRKLPSSKNSAVYRAVDGSLKRSSNKKRPKAKR